MAGASRPGLYDVAIVGLGPVGATLAHLLGVSGVKTLVLERQAAAYHLPRAVHFDDEIMRVFQWIGITDALLPLVRINPGMRFVDRDGALLLDWPRPQVESSHAWHPSWRFHQPDLERVLRDAMRDRTNVTLRTHCEVTGVSDAGDHALLTFENRRAGQTRQARALYVVGCDGARSLVRQAMATGMRDLGFHERWLVVDVLLKRDMPELGDHTVQYCNPARPATYVRSPGRRRRWEIAVLADETSDAISAQARVWDLLSRWLTPQDAELERAAVYSFHSLIAQDWRRGRLFIAGDAAHQTPPFMGQGMCAGIRDAANLAWKLAAAVHHGAGDTLLDSYGSERAPNTQAFIETAIRLGHLINAAERESALRAAVSGVDVPRADGSAQMASIYPPLGPGIGLGPAAGRQFGQPRLADGTRMDEHFAYRPVVVCDEGLITGCRLSGGIGRLSTKQAPLAIRHLEAFKTGAVLLRPDRYVFGTANTPGQLGELIKAYDAVVRAG